ncbi:MAG TPA: hypothetical protein ENF83_03955 [Candidatus Korarchaeota archaeon]|nr:hypothetical protein [Candidatus Korarchaeota archaeon]
MGDEEEERAGLVFVALMFIGAGVGLLFGRPDVGGAIGMGLGFLAMAVLRSRYAEVRAEETAVIGRREGSVLLAVIGLVFIGGGLSMLLGLKIPWEVLGGLLAVAVGLAFLSAAFKLVRLER